MPTAEQIQASYDKTGSVTETARALGIARSTVYRQVSRAEPSDSVKTEYSGNTATVVTQSRSIRTVEDALAYAEIDTKIWEVSGVTINSWESAGKSKGTWSRCQLWQVKVTLKRKAPKFLTDALADYMADIAKIKAPSPKPKSRPRKDLHMLEVALFDAHFGKLAWGQETGTDYDLKIAERVYEEAVGQLLDLAAPYNIDKILFPVGNDFFHVDNWRNETAAGTPQDVDTRFQKIFRVGVEAIQHAVDLCLHTAPVEIVWVPGNHDTATSYYMMQVLEARYAANKHVIVDTSPKERKYVQYGTTLLGLTHGNEEKHHDLPNIMAGEAPMAWAATTHREWHLGHFHKSKETRFNVGDTHVGVPVVVLPSLSGTDKWHYKKGYVQASRHAVAYLWSFDHGYRAHFASTPVRAEQ